MARVRHPDATGRDLLARVPATGERRLAQGTEIQVEDRQVAVLWGDGRVAAELGAGRHVAEDEHGALFFVSIERPLELKWGTAEPFSHVDPELGDVPLRAWGLAAVAIRAPGDFVQAVAGPRGLASTEDAEDLFRRQFVAGLGRVLAEGNGGLTAALADLSPLEERLETLCRAELDALGVELLALYLGDLVLPRHVARRAGARPVAGRGRRRRRYADRLEAALGEQGPPSA